MDGWTQPSISLLSTPENIFTNSSSRQQVPGDLGCMLIETVKITFLFKATGNHSQTLWGTEGVTSACFLPKETVADHILRNQQHTRPRRFHAWNKELPLRWDLDFFRAKGCPKCFRRRAHTKFTCDDHLVWVLNSYLNPNRLNKHQFLFVPSAGNHSYCRG